jgi:hypothetical protein
MKTALLESHSRFPPLKRSHGPPSFRFSTLTVVLPIFALIFAGWLARRIGVLGDHATTELNASRLRAPLDRR